jgi:hypothetical protein
LLLEVVAVVQDTEVVEELEDLENLILYLHLDVRL